MYGNGIFAWDYRKWLSCCGLSDLPSLVKRVKYAIANRALDDEAFIVMLVKDVDHAVRTIKIVEGEENIELYNDARVVDAFERAIERGVKIQFVLKPALDGVVR